MMRRKDELEAFKTRINLTEYAAQIGYVLDRKSTSRNSAVMRHSNGDKVVIARGDDRHWIYFSIRDERDNGSIIDFVMKRKRMNLGFVRQELRPWVGEGSNIARPIAQTFIQSLEPVSRNIAKVAAKFHASEEIASGNEYLEKHRGIPSETFLDPVFASQIRIDERRNCLFPHFNQSGLCGYEVKNQDFTGFAPGGEKGLWYSRPRSTDCYLVICESAIDALSYATLKTSGKSRFFSTGGELNPGQPGLIQAAIKRMPSGSQVIVAVDNDAGGDQILDRVRRVFADLKLPECDLVEDRPPHRGEDWNDVLRSSMGQTDAVLKVG